MSDDDDDIDAVVVDNGSWMIKAGYAGDKTAHVYERTVIGRKTDDSTQEIGTYIGDTACFPSGCSLSWPMDRGIVVDWDRMELVWDFVFSHQLKDDVRDRPMLITEIPGSHRSNRDKMVEILMEKYKVQSLYIIDPGSLAVVSSGRTTAIVLDVGGSTTHVTALYEGKNLQLNNKNNDDRDELSVLPWRLDIGGNDVTNYLQQIVCKKLNVDCGAQNFDRCFQDFENLKHSLVSWQQTGDTDFSFNDGTKVPIDEDFLKCSEVLFQPQLAGQDGFGIDKLLNKALRSCEDGVKVELYSNVILSGGTTFSHGIHDRIMSSLKDDMDNKYNIKVIAPPERRKSTWLGGSIIASLDAFPAMCKSRETYYEKGVAEFLTFSGLEFLMKLS